MARESPWKKTFHAKDYQNLAKQAAWCGKLQSESKKIDTQATPYNYITSYPKCYCIETHQYMKPFR